MARGFARGLREFHGIIHSPKAIKTARDTNLQKAMCSPFPCRKGGRGDRFCGRAVWGNPRNPLIRLIRDSDTVGRGLTTAPHSPTQSTKMGLLQAISISVCTTRT